MPSSITEVTIGGVDEFVTYVKSNWHDLSLYRGQAQDWPLIPKIGRINLRASIAES